MPAYCKRMFVLLVCLSYSKLKINTWLMNNDSPLLVQTTVNCELIELVQAHFVVKL